MTETYAIERTDWSALVVALLNAFLRRVLGPVRERLCRETRRRRGRPAPRPTSRSNSLCLRRDGPSEEGVEFEKRKKELIDRSSKFGDTIVREVMRRVQIAAIEDEDALRRAGAPGDGHPGHPVNHAGTSTTSSVRFCRKDVKALHQGTVDMRTDPAEIDAG